MFVVTNCRNKHMLVVTHIHLSRQKTCFVMTNDKRVCHDKNMLVAFVAKINKKGCDKYLSQQAYFCIVE